MDRRDFPKLVLLEVARRHEEAKAKPEPPKWKVWEFPPWEDDILNGPRYSPSWFGDLTEAQRIAVLRVIHRLGDADLLDLVMTKGGRLQRLRLTEAGERAVEEIREKERLSSTAMPA